jgi:hypothetical protein
MRILIIASPRTGSSELASRLSRYLSLNLYQEPFNPRSGVVEYNLEDNAIVKCIVQQLPGVNNNPDHNISTKKEIVDYWKEYSKNFDKTILLNRKIIKDQVESWHYFLAASRREQQEGNRVRYANKKYTYSRQDLSDYNLAKRYVLWTNQLIKRISYETKIPILYYEDLYVTDGRRYRQFEEKIL